MQTSGLSAGDILAITRGNDNDFGENWIWIIGLLIVAGIFGGGNGIFGGRNNGSDALLASVIANNNNSGLTRSDLFEGFNNQDVSAQLRGITNGLCDGFYAQNTNLLNGFNGIQRDLCSGFNGVNANINQSRFDMQQCCCETNRNIDSVRYENSRNTCDIITNQNAGVQRILDKMCENQTQELRDRLFKAELANSQCAQNAYLLSNIVPTPRPSYIVPNPYCGYGFNNGCGCNSLY